MNLNKSNKDTKVTPTINTGTGSVRNYFVTAYLAYMVLELNIDSSHITHDNLLAWGLYMPRTELLFDLPTSEGDKIPCRLTTNGELRIYHPTKATRGGRIDFTLAYPKYIS